MVNNLQSVTGVAVYTNTSFGEQFLALTGKDNHFLAVAAPSRHVYFVGFITFPPSENYRENWLCDSIGGDDPPSSSALRQTLKSWLDSADLSPLLDSDDKAGHNTLIDSLWAAIRTAQGRNTVNYQVKWYNHNGVTTSDVIAASSLRDAKSKATRHASGTTTRITISTEDGSDGIAYRQAVDMFNGCCLGWRPWENRMLKSADYII